MSDQTLTRFLSMLTPDALEAIIISFLSHDGFDVAEHETNAALAAAALVRLVGFRQTDAMLSQYGIDITDIPAPEEATQ